MRTPNSYTSPCSQTAGFGPPAAHRDQMWCATALLQSPAAPSFGFPSSHALLAVAWWRCKHAGMCAGAAAFGTEPRSW
eukprot:2500867-Prymnesium_polylepis.1